MTVVTVTVGRWSVGVLPVLFMKDVMVISITHHLSLLCPSGSAQAPRVPTPDPSFLVGCVNETEPSVLAYCRLPRNHTLYNTLHPFFADLSILRPRIKGHSFCHGSAVVMREALSRHLCFLHLLAGFAVRLTTTHPSESSK